MECTSLLVKLGINYPQTIISMELIKFTMLLRREGSSCGAILNKPCSTGLLSSPSFFIFPVNKDYIIVHCLYIALVSALEQTMLCIFFSACWLIVVFP